MKKKLAVFLLLLLCAALFAGGGVMETDPLRVGRVYAITLVAPADRNENNNP